MPFPSNNGCIGKVSNVSNDQNAIRNLKEVSDTKVGLLVNEDVEKLTNNKKKLVQDDFCVDENFSGQNLQSVKNNHDNDNYLRDMDDKLNFVNVEKNVFSYETLQELGNFTTSVLCKEKLRFLNGEVKEESFLIASEKWSQVIKNWSKNHFGNSKYRNIIFPKLHFLYKGCVPCVLNNYLRKDTEALICANLIKSIMKIILVFIVVMQIVVSAL